MALKKHFKGRFKLIRLILCIFLLIVLGITFLYHLASFYFSNTYNPHNQPLVQPIYKELYVGSMWNKKPNPNNILAFMDITLNHKMIIFDVNKARIISTKAGPVFDNEHTYVSGPYWESDTKVTFPVLMDGYSGTCRDMYVSQAPDWRFSIEPCNPIFEGKMNTNDFIHIPDRKMKVTLPDESDMRGISVEGALVSPQGDLYAILAKDRFHKTFYDGNSYVNDARIIDKKGCTIAQIGTKDKYGSPEVAPIGWTHTGDLVVHRHGWLKDRLMGLFLISKDELKKMEKQSRCGQTT